MERRSSERTSVDVSLTCRIPARPLRATVHDVSRYGCQVEVAGAPVELGGTALFELPGMDGVSGQVVWTRGKLAGIRFDRALTGNAAIALGLEQPRPVEIVAEIAAVETAGGVLRHWFRRLTSRFA